jgi:hypothetical protein
MLKIIAQKPRNIRDPIMNVPETDRLFTLLTIGVEFSRGVQCIGKYFILPSKGFSLSGHTYFCFQQTPSVEKKKEIV